MVDPADDSELRILLLLREIRHATAALRREVERGRELTRAERRNNGHSTGREPEPGEPEPGEPEPGEPGSH